MRRLLAILALLQLVPAMAAADELVLAVGHSVPPYVIAENWSGLEYDVVREALALEGHTVKPRLMALARVPKELEAGLADAAMTMRPDSGVQAFYSDSHVTYRNFAITLADRDFTINRVEDLAGHSVVAFQNAAKYLGPAFAATAAGNSHYREEAGQALQPLLLFLGRTDVVVADRNIFGWFATSPEVEAKVDARQRLRFHPIFPPTDYFVAFRDQALRDSFNRGLKRLKESGEYRRILDRYVRYLREEDGLRH